MIRDHMNSNILILTRGFLIFASAVAALSFARPGISTQGMATKRPNILFAISDDQSWPYAGVYGSKSVRTPAFDRVAREGVLFTHAFSASPGCSPSRAAILTGLHTWQLEQAGTHASSFPSKFMVYPDILESAGYYVGFTGKGWGPGNYEAGGRTRNPAGPEFNARMLQSAPEGMNRTDYAANFKDFLVKKPKGQPFCFWYGGKEPHRSFEKGSGLRAGKSLEDVQVPPFLPDTKEIRSDMLDYFVEIEHFDHALGQIIHMLETSGELDNTLVIVTSDNGMPFPRAKANLYDYGTRLPLAIRWPERVKGGRVIDDFISFIDFAPTILEATGAKPTAAMTGRSFLNLLVSDKNGRIDPARNKAFTARERHSSSRVDNLGYPCRALRTYDFLYIRNLAPDRWPAGDPRGTSGDPAGYYDIDSSPSKSFLINQGSSKEYQRLFDLAVGKRPAEELYDVRNDPGNLTNLAARPEYAQVKAELCRELDQYLKKTYDPRILGNGDIFESYPRYSPIRKFE